MTAPSISNASIAQQAELLLSNAHSSIKNQYAEFAGTQTESEIDALKNKLQSIFTKAKSDIKNVTDPTLEHLKHRIDAVEQDINKRISSYSTSRLNTINNAAKRQKEAEIRQEELKEYPQYKQDALFSQIYNEKFQDHTKISFNVTEEAEDAYLAAKKAQSVRPSSPANAPSSPIQRQTQSSSSVVIEESNPTAQPQHTTSSSQSTHEQVVTITTAELHTNS